MKESTPINAGFQELVRSEHADCWMASKTQRYHEYRKKWKENPQNHIDEGYPLSIDIEASSACNLKCPMCTRTIGEKRKAPSSKHFDFELYKRIIDEAVQIGVYALKLNWLGEPLMNPRIIDMIKYAKQSGIEDVLMNTNAVLLNESMAHGIVEAGLDNIIFSFDSPYKEAYEKIRVGAVYEQVLENIRRFHAIRQELGSLSPLSRVQMVLTPENEVSLQDFIDLFIDTVDIIAYNTYKEHDVNRRSLHTDGIEFCCSQVFQRLLVSAEGKVGICCYDTERSVETVNIKDATIHSVWNGTTHKEILEKHMNYQWHQIDLCVKCPLTFSDKSGTAW
jgi:MoaA/NifB/PqqE/SkfB family radical SAM enzyme